MSTAREQNSPSINAMILRNKRVARACHAFFVQSEEGRELLTYLKESAHYDKSSLHAGNEWNTTAAAQIEGARDMVRVILGLNEAHANRLKQQQDDE